MREGTAMMNPRNFLPRVASSLLRGGPPKAYYPSFCSCRLAAFQLSYFPSLSLIISPKSPLAQYHLSNDVVIRILGPVDRVSDFEIDEVPVYEGLSELGFRDRVPSLVEKVSEELEISSGQLNPPSCIILIALQNLCDLEGLSIGVAEVLYSFAITPLDGGERRYHLHPRGELPVQEVVKEERKRLPVFDGHWTEKVAFMYLPGFSTVWCTADIPSVDPSLGEKTIKQVPFLVSKKALECCSIWGKLQAFYLFTANQFAERHASSNTSGSKGEEELAEYKRALEVMSVKKAASKKPLFIKSNKRQAATALASSSKKKSRTSGSTLKSSSDPTIVLANLNIKVFPLTPVIHPEGDSSASIQLIQGDLFQAMSQLFHLGERMGDHASLKTDLAELTLQLREEKDNILAKEKEIKALKLKVRNQDEDGALATAENVSLREQLEQQEEETFDADKTMEASGAIVMDRWEQMREWLNHQTDSWDLEGALKRYKMGLPAPTFEGEPSIPSGTEAEKTLEPVTDDPPAL
ncbi:LOW QUALITY PROTEIN: hypothetical protein HID58_007974 [Brassica napus]|uniref:Uncharacterized protein n=1 Tax=Brassica napus TaxID=3708 RepID=A0ABQ7XJC3_BRANA|nr:LOW QUALITY PROTEIN: hypothetical protein HID58_007974 [Brassica napus]